MKNFQTVVQELLHNHERQRRYIAFLTALCMLMAFTVSIILIEPAESMTGELACGMAEHIHNENCFTYTCGLENDASHVHSADCRTLTCEKTEHAHSENCYIHEDEQTAQIMQINSPQIINNDTPEGDSASGNEGISPQNYGIMPIAETDTREWFDSALAEKPTDTAYSFESNITGVDLKVGGAAKAELDSDGNWKITTEEDQIGATFTLHYSIDNSEINLNQPYIYYQIPPDIDIPEDFFGEGRTVSDPSFSGVAGYFSINKNGMLVIRFTQDYIKAKLLDSGTFQGSINFSGYIHRADSAEGDKDITIHDTEFNFDFKSNNFTVTKSGSVKDVDSTNNLPTVEWEIDVKNQQKEDANNTLKGKRLEDPRFKNAVGDITVEPSGYGEFKTNEAGNKYYQFSDTFTGAEPENVKFTFKEAVTDFNDKGTTGMNNTASLYDEDELIDDGSASVGFDKSTVEKSGQVNYTGENDTIEWSVTVKRPYNQSLAGYYVQDEVFKYLDKSKISVKDKSGNSISFDKEGEDKIKFAEGVTASEVTITYTTKAIDTDDGVDRSWMQNGEGTVRNEAHFLNPSNEEIGDVFGNVNYEKKYNIDSKTGVYDRIENKIIWNIKASAKGEPYLNGYTLTDEAFEKLTALTGLKINGISQDISGQTFPITLTINDKTVTIEKTEKTLKINGEGVQNIEITYETNAKEASSDGTNKAGDVVTNTVTDNHDNSKTSNGVGIEKRDNYTHKSYLKSSSVAGEKDGVWYVDPANPEELSRTMYWQVDMRTDNGFDTYELKDSLTDPPTGATHYIDKNSIKVWAYQDDIDGRNTPIELSPAADYYTITWKPNDDNPTGFTIDFTGNVDSAHYHFVKVTYESEFTIDASKIDWENAENGKVKFTFENAANDTSAEHTYTLQNKNYVEDTSLTIEKVWNDDNNTTGSRPESIKYKIQRRLGTSGSWETIYWDESSGEWVVDTTNEKTYELSSGNVTGDSNKWSTKWEHLPKDTSDHNANYYYRVIEVSVDGYTTEYSNNSDMSGVLGNGTITITNNMQRGIKKSVLDKNGKKIPNNSIIDVNDLNTLTIDGVDYYIIQYSIDVQTYGGSNFILKDKIPEGFSLVYNKNVTWHQSYEPHHPNIYQTGIGLLMLDGPNDNVITTGDTSNKFGIDDEYVYFGIAAQVRSIEYEIKIPVEELRKRLEESEAGLDIINNVSDKDGASSSSKVTITGVVPQTPPEEKGALTKTANNDVSHGRLAQEGRLEYSVYVNPYGKNLSNSGEFDIVDDLNFGDSDIAEKDGTDDLGNEKYKITHYTAAKLKEMLKAELVEVTVEELTDYTVNDDGSISVYATKKLDSSEYSYLFDDSPTTAEEIAVRYTFENNSANGFSAGEKVTIVISTGQADHRLSKDSEYGECSIKYGDKIIANYENMVCDENGNLEITVTIPEDATSEKVLNIANNSAIKEISATGIRSNELSVSDARLTVTVPDERPLRVTYIYKILNGGKTLYKGSMLNVSNSVAMNTGSVTASDRKNNIEFSVNKADANVTTGNSPKIVKYNVGDSSEKDFTDVEFLIARYEENEWVFASSVTKDILEDTTKNPPTTIETRYLPVFEGSSYTVTDNSIPGGLINAENAVLKFSADDYEKGDNKLAMDSGYVYKFIEIKAPEGYEAADSEVAKIKSGGYSTLKELLSAQLGNFLNNPSGFKTGDYKEYYNLLNKFVSVRYYQLESTGTEESKTPIIPNGVNKSDIETVKPGGTIGIPNSKLIKINAKKIWEDSATDAQSVELTLYWSYKKSTSDIPVDAKKATAEDLGMTELENPKTVTKSTEIVSWENLPNGIDDKPIYYYVKETAYTLKTADAENEYTRQSNGTYVDKNGNIGKYYPSYSGNATNKNNSMISVKNTSKLTVYKEWLKSDGTELDTSDIPDDVLKNGIKFKLFGRKLTTGTEVEIGEYVLTAESNWKYEIPTEKLTEYTDFRVEEVDAGTNLYGFTVSYDYDVNEKTGDITITNKSKTPVKVDVSVNKVWKDSGSETHPAIQVKLYRTTESRTDNGVGLTNENLVTDVENTVTLNDSNKWSYTWKDLPYRDETTKSPYFYYVVEEKVEGYETSYDRVSRSSSTTITITNYQSGKLNVEKKWQDTNGESLTENLPDSIEVELYRKSKETSSETVALDDMPMVMSLDENSKTNLKVYALGDSITNGFWTSTEDYPHKLESSLKENGYTEATVENRGTNYLKIEDINLYDLSSEYKFVLLIVGTNNVLHSNDTATEMIEKLKTLIGTIYEKNPDAVLLVGSIPDIGLDDSGVAPKGNKDKDGRNGACYEDNGTNEAILKIYSDIISEYNKQLKSLPNEYSDKKVYYVDINSAVGDKLRDGIHPNAEGYIAIANAFKTAIDSYFDGTIDDSGSTGGGTAGGGTSGNPTESDAEKAERERLPADFYLNGEVNTEIYKPCVINNQNRFTLKRSEDSDWKFTIDNLPKYDEKGNEYLYYVREVAVNGYETTYENNNGQVADGSGTITIINKQKPVTGLELEKIWQDSSGNQSVNAEPKTPLDRIQAVVKRKIVADNSKYDEYLNGSGDSGGSDKEDSSGYVSITEPIAGQEYDVISLCKDKNITKVGVVFKNSGFANIYLQLSADYTINFNYQGSVNENQEVFGDIKQPTYFKLTYNYEEAKIKEIRLYYETPEEPFKIEIDKSEVVEGEYALLSANKDGVSYSFKPADYVEFVSDSKSVIKALKAGKVTITGEYTKDGVKTESTVELNISPATDSTFTKTVEFKKDTDGDGKWLPDAKTQEELKHLDAEDANHNKYYYYVEEVFEGDDTALQGYEKPRYFNDTKELKEGEGVELAEGSLVSLKVVNTRIESSTTTMPSTGGNGAGKCYTVGGMLLLMSACGWAMRRRKRVIPH